MNKIFITGGSGFIGKALVRYLSEKNYQVTSFDLKKDNFLKKKNIKYFSGTILDSKIINRIIKNHDIVIHLAAALGVKYTDNNALDCLKINIEGTQNILKSAIKNKIKKLIFISSSEVYGEQNNKKISESDNLIPKSVYAITKLAGEEYTKAYCSKYNVKFNICRFFNVYGFDQREDFVIPTFFKNSILKKRIQVYGNGNQIRSFCNVYDAAKGLIKIMEKGRNGEIYNIGNDMEPITIKKLAKRIKKITNNNTLINFINYNKSDRSQLREIMYRLPNLNKAKTHLNYEASIKLEDGLKMMLKKKYL